MGWSQNRKKGKRASIRNVSEAPGIIIRLNCGKTSKRPPRYKGWNDHPVTRSSCTAPRGTPFLTAREGGISLDETKKKQFIVPIFIAKGEKK